MDVPLANTSRDLGVQPRQESIFQLAKVKELGQPKLMKESDIFMGAGEKAPKPKRAPKEKRSKFDPPKAKEPTKKMRSAQGKTYRK
jgi:hypothetical protein